MNIYASLALCFLPLVAIFFIATKFCKISIFISLFATLLGFLAVIPISILQIYGSGKSFFDSTDYLIQLARAILVSGLIEEIVKMATLFLLPAQKTSRTQFFMLALIVGISLGCFESTIYFLQRLQHASSLGAHLIYAQIFTRMFTSCIVHMLCAGLSSFFVWHALKHKLTLFPLICAILVHGLYDFFALQKAFHFFSYIAILFAAIECRIYYKKDSD
ncbi:MAG: PrsW family intramembrane metalloprotease [Treponema sp.]|nr:PrsW family intramembrane metalloprotease [Treponema sp.]